jgi:dTDP-glucose 4,6-dehydratase
MNNRHHTPKNTLVTGGAGFIGSNFVHYWLEQYPHERIVVLDDLTYAGNRANLAAVEDNPQFRFVHGDILDTPLVEQIMAEEQIDTIVHFAAESHVDRSIHGPDAFLKTNIEGTHSLLKAAKKMWLDDLQGSSESGQRRSSCSGKGEKPHRFHHVSTDEVYGTLEPDAPAFTEKNQYLPNSPYAASKASSDHIVRSYHHTYGLNTTISNCSNNYGPYQFPEKLIPLIIAHCLDGKSLPIYGDGKQIRDWLYVDDHNRGIDQIIRNGRIDHTYNIGGNNEWTNIDIVTLVCELMDQHHPVGAPHTDLITYVKDRAGHDRRYAIDASKIMSELGYKPVETFETGIRKTVQWYLDNEQWWRCIMDGSYQEWIKKNY